ncbi:MAG: penicillin-binding protein 1C [Bacteroidota bacterium]|nr:penicillin-binding protein 1C [Bacteroidota bacterium]
MVKRYTLILLITFLIFYFLFSISYKEPFVAVPLSTAVFDSQGSLLGARIAADEQWRFEPGDSIPQKYLTCLLAFEDRYFFKHPGVNPFALFRALGQNIREGRIVSGGSTISMQVIRLSRKDKPRNVWQKILEMFLAVRLEFHTKKPEVLSIYAANAPFGGNVVGLEAAAWRYFNRPAYQLSWAESATLAVLPNAPALIHPGRNREALQSKRDRLLGLLLAEETLDSLDYQLATEEPLPIKPLPLPNRAEHLVDYFHKRGKGRVQTMVHPWYQDASREVLTNHHKNLRSNQIHNLAALILDNESGEILVYHGNSEDDGSGLHGHHVDVIRRPRSSGSILKPILYACMLDAGEILPGTIVPDVPTRYVDFTPHNFTKLYDGAVHADEALIRSLNVPAVRMLREYGILRFYDQLKGMSISTLSRSAENYGLTLILGGAEVTLWDIVQLYSGWARQLDLLSEGPLSSEAIYLTFEAMKRVKRPENEAGWDQFLSAHPVAWKTGTSFGYRDAWAVGVSRKYTVGVWVGNGDGEGRPGLTGSTAAAPVLFDLVRILPDGEWFEPPVEQMEEVVICRESGMRAFEHCLHRDTIQIPAKGLETPVCPFHIGITLDQSGRYRVHGNCYPIENMLHKKWFVLPPGMDAFYKGKNPFYRSLPPWMNGCLPDAHYSPIEILYPHQGEEIFLPVNVSGGKESIIAEAAHVNPSLSVFWFLDENFLGTTRGIHKMTLQPSIGSHRISLTDAEGNSVERMFRIK